MHQKRWRRARHLQRHSQGKVPAPITWVDEALVARSGHLRSDHLLSRYGVRPFCECGGREAIRTPGLLIANEEKSKAALQSLRFLRGALNWTTTRTTRRFAFSLCLFSAARRREAGQNHARCLSLGRPALEFVIARFANRRISQGVINHPLKTSPDTSKTLRGWWSLLKSAA